MICYNLLTLHRLQKREIEQRESSVVSILGLSIKQSVIEAIQEVQV